MGIEKNLLDPDKDFDEFCEFVSQTYGDGHFLQDRAYLQWWFAGSPFRETKYPTDILLFRFNGKIVAMNGHITTATHIKDELVPVTWMANTMVHPDYRRGLGVGVVKASLDFFPYVGSISYNAFSKPILKSLEFTMFGYQTCERAVLVIDSQKLSRYSKVVLPVAPRNTGNKGTIRELSGADLSSVAMLWEKVRHRYGVSTLRNEEYLDWRYFRHPRGGYKLLGIGEGGDLMAVAVVREDGAELKALRIIDLFGVADSIPPLLENMRAYAAARDIAFIDFQCSGSPDKDSFLQAGFAWLTEEDKSNLPFLLNPIVTDRIFNENIALHPANGRIEFDLKDTYFVKGDADRDRAI